MTNEKSIGSTQESTQNCESNKSSDMIIDILFNLISEDSHHSQLSTNIDHIKEQDDHMTFENITSKYNLDFKQRVAFEIMACSFLLKSLQEYKIINNKLYSLFDSDDNYLNNLSKLNKKIREKGGEDNLVMFLSGMGGTGKSEVIKAFVDFAKNISHILDWNFDLNVIKIAALTGTAACEIPNGSTLHRIACLNKRKISKEDKDIQDSTRILIIDEVSFLDATTIETLDKNMRILKNTNDLFGGVQVVFVGDFFQMFPVGVGQSLVYKETIQFNAINKAVFLNKSHRFRSDPQYGEIMRRFRVGLATKEDIQMINTRFFKNDNVVLPPT